MIFEYDEALFYLENSCERAFSASRPSPPFAVPPSELLRCQTVSASEFMESKRTRWLRTPLRHSQELTQNQSKLRNHSYASTVARVHECAFLGCQELKVSKLAGIHIRDQETGRGLMLRFTHSCASTAALARSSFSARSRASSCSRASCNRASSERTASMRDDASAICETKVTLRKCIHLLLTLMCQASSKRGSRKRAEFRRDDAPARLWKKWQCVPYKGAFHGLHCSQTCIEHVHSR